MFPPEIFLMVTFQIIKSTEAGGEVEKAKGLLQQTKERCEQLLLKYIVIVIMKIFWLLIATTADKREM